MQSILYLPQGILVPMVETELVAVAAAVAAALDQSVQEVGLTQVAVVEALEEMVEQAVKAVAVAMVEVHHLDFTYITHHYRL